MAPSEVIGVHAGTDNEGLQGKVYVALGDSISAGRFATAQDGTFPALVADELGMNLNLVARSGAKAAWAIPQLRAVVAAHPALVTIEDRKSTRLNSSHLVISYAVFCLNK